MVGGAVREVLYLENKIWVNVLDTYRPDPYNDCAIYVARNEISEQIRPGDSLWWQGRFAMWTPKGSKPPNYDIQIPRIGYSGVNRPSEERIEYSY